ncbi:MAG: hypothetical protein QGH15_22595, partial [Kiritimatiellia bacterium]|nr:hypothetical protein [Kiritimatiellia bacterium]
MGAGQSDLPEYLVSREQNQCLIHGVVKDGLADDGAIEITPTNYHRPDTISRSLEYFEHPDGPCLSMLDYDPNPENEH